MKVADHKTKALLVMLGINLIVTAQQLNKAMVDGGDLQHFRLIHLLLVFNCGMLTGAIIFKSIYQKRHQNVA